MEAAAASVSAAGDLTRMTRAMQKDGLKSVDFTVSGGTKVSAKSGKPLQNALHFRADYMNPHSGDDITVWGSIEAKQYGTQPVKARREFTTNEEFQDYTRKVQAVRERAAAPYVDPQSPQAAAKLLRAKYGTNRFYSSDIQMRDGKEGVAICRQYSRRTRPHAVQRERCLHRQGAGRCGGLRIHVQ